MSTLSLDRDVLAVAALKAFGAAAVIALMASAVMLAAVRPALPPVAEPELVHVAASRVAYRPAGEFIAGGRVVDAPETGAHVPGGVLMMRYQVSVAEWRACLADGGCPREALATIAARAAAPDMPAVGVNWSDAAAYAQWLSRRTGRAYRLPSDEEWALAAGSRWVAEVVPETDGASGPAARWLSTYGRYEPAERTLKPRGAFGENENGLFDIGGNVWEWTSTCFGRFAVTDGAAVLQTQACGIRVAAGRHRAYVPAFLRDASKAGCAGGPPPANLGIRLVRDRAEERTLSFLFARLGERLRDFRALVWN